jgi:hypothetical protein
MDKGQFEILKNLGKIIENTPESMPDIEKLIDNVIIFLQYISTDEMEKMEEEDPVAFEKHLDVKFIDFTNRYYTVFKILLDKPNREKNVQKLLEVFEKFNKIKNGENTIDDAYQEYTEELNSEMIYPKCGGKENFIKEMKKGNINIDKDKNISHLFNDALNKKK